MPARSSTHFKALLSQPPSLSWIAGLSTGRAPAIGTIIKDRTATTANRRSEREVRVMAISS